MPSGQSLQLYAKALELTGHDLAAATRLLKLIVDTNQSALTWLCDSFAEASWDGVASAAHRIAGSARMLECDELVALLKQLEAAAGGLETKLAAVLRPRVVKALERLNASIQEALDSNVPH